MEGKEDEFGELYADVLPRPSPYNNLNTKSAIIGSKNGFCRSELKVQNEDEFEIHEGFVEDEEEMESKDFNLNIMSCFNNNDGRSFVKSENHGTKSVDQNDDTKVVNFNILSHSKNDIGVENEQEKGVGNKALVENKAFASEFKECDSLENVGFVVDFEEKSCVDDLKSHPIVLELMSGTSADDVYADEEDEVNLRVLKIVSDCGIGVKQGEDSDDGSDSDNGLNLIFSDREISGCDGVDDKGEGMRKSEIMGNITSYDDNSYHFEDNCTVPGGSCEDVSHSRLDFVLPSHQTIFDIDIDDLKEKRWRRPGAVLSDYFNFGLNEPEWKNYCKKMVDTEMDVTSENSQGKVAGDSCKRSAIPIGEAIPVKIGVSERIPSFETKFPRLSQSNTVIEIIIHDISDNDNKADNEEISQICSFQSASDFRKIHVDVIRPFPLDWPCQFFPVYGQLTCPPEERVEEGTSTRPNNLSRKPMLTYPARNDLKDRVEMRPKNIRPTRSIKPMLTYPARNDSKKESWIYHTTDLIHKYGGDNNEDLVRKYGGDNSKDLVRKYGKDNSKDDRKRNNAVHSRIKYRNETTENSRIKKRYETCSSGSRSVWDRVSDTKKNVSFKEDEKKQPRDEENRRKAWSGKWLSGNDSETEREDGEIISIQKRVSKRNYFECRSNYRQGKVTKQSSSQKPRKRACLRPSY